MHFINSSFITMLFLSIWGIINIYYNYGASTFVLLSRFLDVMSNIIRYPIINESILLRVYPVSYNYCLNEFHLLCGVMI